MELKSKGLVLFLNTDNRILKNQYSKSIRKIKEFKISLLLTTLPTKRHNNSCSGNPVCFFFSSSNLHTYDNQCVYSADSTPIGFFFVYEIRVRSNTDAGFFCNLVIVFCKVRLRRTRPQISFYSIRSFELDSNGKSDLN